MVLNQHCRLIVRTVCTYVYVRARACTYAFAGCMEHLQDQVLLQDTSECKCIDMVCVYFSCMHCEAWLCLQQLQMTIKLIVFYLDSHLPEVRPNEFDDYAINQKQTYECDCQSDLTSCCTLDLAIKNLVQGQTDPDFTLQGFWSPVKLVTSKGFLDTNRSWVWDRVAKFWHYFLIR